MSTLEKNPLQKFHAFYWKEMVVGSGIVNGVLNALIYFFTTKETMGVAAFSLNILFTMVILSAILIPLYPALARMKLKKATDFEIPYRQEEHLLFAYYPKGKWGSMLLSLLLCVLIATPLCTGLVSGFGLLEVTRMQGTIIKGIGTGLCSAVAYYLSVTLWLMREK